jgi:hypothetical protein
MELLMWTKQALPQRFTKLETLLIWKEKDEFEDCRQLKGGGGALVTVVTCLSAPCKYAGYSPCWYPGTTAVTTRVGSSHLHSGSCISFLLSNLGLMTASSKCQTVIIPTRHYWHSSKKRSGNRLLTASFNTSNAATWYAIHEALQNVRPKKWNMTKGLPGTGYYTMRSCATVGKSLYAFR